MPIELDPQLRALKDELVKKWDRAEDLHKAYRKQWDRWYLMWRGHQDLRTAVASSTTTQDKDQVIQEARGEWGSNLFPPYVFATVETVMPRVVSQRPRMLILPRNQVSEKNVENLKFLIDSQQERCEYERKLQSIARYGLIFGLGAGKVLWRKDMRRQVGVARASGLNRALRGVEWVQKPYVETLWDDPDVQVVNIYDLRWDPCAIDMESARYVFHRTWRDTAYCLDKIRSGKWELLPQLDAQTLKESGSAGRYREARQPGLDAAGLPNVSLDGNEMHEVWEFHDGNRIVTMLDKEYPVAQAQWDGPAGEMPIDIYRPTEVPDQLPGMGEVEPVTDLVNEMAQIRRDRRDNADLSIARTYLYQEGVLDPEDWKIQPYGLIPVKGADLASIVRPLDPGAGEVPNSSWQEENNLRMDIQMANGLSDVVNGGPSQGGGATETATGAQLVLAGATVRIELKTRRLEIETIKRQTRKFALLDQRRIVTNRQIREPMQPTPMEPEQRWKWRVVTPGELQGEYEFEPEGGSTAPTNVPQDRADAQTFVTLLNTALAPLLDGRQVAQLVLEKMGVRNPSLMLAPDRHVPDIFPLLLEKLLTDPKPDGYGLDPQLVTGIIGQALNMAKEMEAQEQGGQQMGATPQGPQTNAPSNGQANGQPDPATMMGVGPSPAAPRG